MYKQDLALNNLQGLIYRKIQTANCCFWNPGICSYMDWPLDFLFLFSGGERAISTIIICVWTALFFLIFLLKGLRLHIITENYIFNFFLTTTTTTTSSSSSCRAASMDIPDPLSPLLLIVHSLWSSCFCPAICGGP